MSYDLADRVYARRRAERETERKALLARVLEVLDDLGPRHGLRGATLFGSLAKPGRFRGARSDIDIAVEGLRPERYFTLRRDLEALLEREVDLVEIETVHFADRILATGVPWTPKP